ncbi:MAG: signal peptidase I [Candidatus Methanoperedens sp.]|nr:signal peptidase I [Candidatus Methanoperedens sp.]MCZ7405670.1 signal peptidase I [Candidatus Methanoperedens sp.]
MDLTNKGADISEGLIVSGFVLILLAVFYLYKKENRIIIGLIASQYKPRRAELKKDTTVRDWSLFLINLVIIVILSLKLITPVVVVSDSMKPGFQRGDMIIVQSIFLTPEVGDIVMFSVKDKNYNISHRIISIKNGAIITKGDNNPRKDDYNTRQENIKAKAIQINNNALVIKNFGSLFITDYSKQGVISKWGDQFTFMQNLSAAIKTWGVVLTIFSVFGYIIMMLKEK